MPVDERIADDRRQIDFTSAHFYVLVDHLSVFVPPHDELRPLHLGIRAEHAAGVTDVGPFDVKGMRPRADAEQFGGAPAAHEEVV